jgi:phosphoserine phosphatase
MRYKLSNITANELKSGLHRIGLILFVVSVLAGCASSEKLTSRKPVYKKIPEFSSKVNTRFKSFLHESQHHKGRKVAVFDCDGTLMGQVPHYLADEAPYEYAARHYKGKHDSLSRAKMQIIEQMLHGNNVGNKYIKNRIHFFAGLPVDSVEQLGKHVYNTHYKGKFYPGMKGVVQNLKNFGFEVWIISASPEVLYQQFSSAILGIPKNRIIGVKSVIDHGIITNKIIHPVPQAQGKAKTIATFIKTKPLFAAGNSMGDVQMIKQSTGLRWIVNPNNSDHVTSLNGKTLKSYAKAHNWVIVHSPDRSADSLQWISDKWGVPVNSENK